MLCLPSRTYPWDILPGLFMFVFAFSLSAMKYDQHDVQFIPSPKLLLSPFCVCLESFLDGWSMWIYVVQATAVYV